MTHHLLAYALIIAIAILASRARPGRGHSLRYQLYLRSPFWRVRRRIWILRAGGRCQRCHGRRQLAIHHRTYTRLGHEHRRDVEVLCWDCHQHQDA